MENYLLEGQVLTFPVLKVCCAFPPVTSTKVLYTVNGFKPLVMTPDGGLPLRVTDWGGGPRLGSSGSARSTIEVTGGKGRL